MINFITEILERISDPPPEERIERTCEKCRFLRDWGCALLSGNCVNNPYRPYYQKLLQQSPVGYADL